MTITSNVNGMWTGDRTAVAVGASPFTFVNTENCSVIAFISAGTVVSVTFSRDGVVFDNCGLMFGMVALNPNDRIIVTYTMAPTIVYYPH